MLEGEGPQCVDVGGSSRCVGVGGREPSEVGYKGIEPQMPTQKMMLLLFLMEVEARGLVLLHPTLLFTRMPLFLVRRRSGRAAVRYG